MSDEKVRVVLGCGQEKWDNALHIDTRTDVEPDMLWDLNFMPWPIEDDLADEVIAKDIIEHLNSVVNAVEEIHRILKPGGVVYIETPHFQHENSWHDPSHLFHLTERSFDYFDPDTQWGKKYSYYSRRKYKILNRMVDGGNIKILMEKRDG